MEDREFIRREKVPMTKEEIRSISLSYLELFDAKNILDVGAGSGSVILEAMVSFPHLKGTAIEMKEDALETIKVNVEHLDKGKGSDIVSRLTIIDGKAPSKIDDSFDRIFVGGTAGNVHDIIDWCADLMTDEGIMVMTFVTLENYFKAMDYLKKHEKLKDFRGMQLAISRMAPLAKYTILKPENPIWLISAKKGKN